MAQNNYGGPEHGVLQWLPPTYVGTSHGFNQLKRFGSGVDEARLNGIKSTPVIELDPPLMFSHHSKSRRHEKRIKGRKRVGGGPGMQAIFLGSGPRSSGTGVFLPRGDDPDPKSTKSKPGVSPVLLPTHTIQALNLNVRELAGQQIIKSRLPGPLFSFSNRLEGKCLQFDDYEIVINADETKYSERKIEEKSETAPKGDSLCLFPEYNLPEEWTY